MFEFGGGLQELLVILVVALLVVGPKRLPEVGRALARAMRELRRAQDEFRSTLETNLQLNEPDTVPPAPQPGAANLTPITVPPASAPAADTSVMTSHAELVEVEVEPYLAQRGARLFHDRRCRWATRLNLSERLGFGSAESATAQGLLPCPMCHPLS